MDDPLKGSAFWDKVDAFLNVKKMYLGTHKPQKRFITYLTPALVFQIESSF